MKFDECITILSQMGGRAVPLTFQVLEGMQFDCLVGDDFLKAVGAIMDYAHGNMASPFMTHGVALQYTVGLRDHVASC